MKIVYYCMLHKEKTEDKPLKQKKCLKEIGRKNKKMKRCKYLIIYEVKENA